MTQNESNDIDRKEQTPDGAKKIDEEEKSDSLSELRNQIEELKKDLEKERRKSAEQINRMKYLQADMINLQKQSDKVLAESKNQVRLLWILEIISIKEDLERALQAVPSRESSSLVDGLNLVLSRIENTLKAEDVKPISAQRGLSFDPVLHEAVAFQETDDEENQGKILSVIGQGYMVSGKVVKPALVEVSRRRVQSVAPKREGLKPKLKEEEEIITEPIAEEDGDHEL